MGKKMEFSRTIGFAVALGITLSGCTEKVKSADEHDREPDEEDATSASAVSSAGKPASIPTTTTSTAGAATIRAAGARSAAMASAAWPAPTHRASVMALA